MPDVPPADIAARWNHTSRGIHVSWSEIPVEFVHGTLLSYSVAYWPTASPGMRNVTTTAPSVTWVTLIGVQYFTEYAVNVSGVTSQGHGPWGEVFVSTKGDGEFY